MRNEYAEALRGFREDGYELRYLLSTGHDAVDARRRQEMANSGWEWTHTVCGPKESDTEWHFRRPIARPKEGR